MSNIVLSAQSSSNEIKAYFNSVLTLTKTGEKFPVDLDDVWTLCYNQKIGAIRFLADSGQFYEGEDYILLCQKAKQTEVGSGGHNRQVYMLSVPCMEYLIARKVRAVFEVYRRVFHEFLNTKRMSKAEMRMQVFMDMQADISRQSNVIKKQSKRIAALVSQLESEKEAKRERLAIASEVKSGDIEKWLSESRIKGLYKLSDLHRRYHGYCGNDNSAYFTTRKLGNILRKKGYTSIHKRNGTWFII